jgi:hypothetical protein
MLICCVLAIAKRALYDMAGPCFVCDAAIAPFGYAWLGFERDEPVGKRGHLWTCTDHRDDGEQRLQAAIAAFYCRSGPHQEITHTINPVKGPLE